MSKKLMYVPYVNGDVCKEAENNEKVFAETKSKFTLLPLYQSSFCENLKTLSRPRKIGGQSEGRLDHRTLHRLALGQTNVYYTERQKLCLKDLAVSILIDESADMAGDKSGICRRGVIALAEALSSLGIKFEVIGQHTENCEAISEKAYQRRCPMKIDIFKAFNESFEGVKYRLGATESVGGNLENEALLHTFERAMRIPAKRRIFIVMNGGMPSGTIDPKAGEAHLGNVIAECRKSAEVYGIGVLSDDAQNLYGEKNFFHLDSVERFGIEFFKALRKIIG